VCFAEAYHSALKAVYQPKEGTILTAMRVWAQVFGTMHRTAESIGELFDRALKELDIVVQSTRNTLPEQRRLGLADAGAIGFYRFIEGFAAAFLGRPVRAETGVRLADFVEEHPQSDTSVDWALTHRYCTEVLFAYDSEKNLFALREELAQIGDSLMMTWTEGKARVHLHTDSPAKAVALVAQNFIMSEHKVEDMHMQMRLSKRYPGKTALILDSIADIPRELLEQEHVYELPMNLMADGVAYYDKRTADAAMLARYRGRVTSSQQMPPRYATFSHLFLPPTTRSLC
jgi:dihydroxyacetone kinase-like predicted kinase